jgi:hypothetical protein
MRIGYALLTAGMIVLAACSEGSNETSTPSAGDGAATNAPPATATERTEVAQVNACSLLSKDEIEAITGRTSLEPREERAAELSICSYGDPESPKIGDRPLIDVAKLSVFSGGNGYYAGPLKQAQDGFDMIERNAGNVTPVEGISERAYWTGDTLRALRGAYFIEVEVDGDSREMAEKIATQMLARMP